MKRLRLVIGATLFLFLAAACADTEAPVETSVGASDDGVLVIEGIKMSEEFGYDLVSPVRKSPRPFVRVGLMWDADPDSPLAVRTSADGVDWSEWRPVVTVFKEGKAHAGYVDAGGAAGFVQYRVAEEGEFPPDFLRVEFIEEVQDEEAQIEPGPEVETATHALARPSNVNSRASWGARQPKCVSYSAAADKITVHHTVTPTNDSLTPQARLRQIQSYHMDSRGWCDVGYHFLISRDGRLWEGRPHNVLGAHTANRNSRNIGFSFMGDYSSTRVTGTQLCNAAGLAHWLAGHYGFGISGHLFGHRDFGGTACPGNALYGQLPSLRAQAAGGCGASSSGGDDEGSSGGGGNQGGGGGGSAIIKGVSYVPPNGLNRVPGATIWLNTGSRTTSNRNGVFYFYNLRAGHYRICGKKDGYKQACVERDLQNGELKWGSVPLERE